MFKGSAAKTVTAVRLWSPIPWPLMRFFNKDCITAYNLAAWDGGAVLGVARKFFILISYGREKVDLDTTCKDLTKFTQK